MQIKYCCPFWGCEQDEPGVFFDKVFAAGYDGVEINLPQSEAFADLFVSKLADTKNERDDFVFILQHLTQPHKTNIRGFINDIGKKIEELAAYSPDFINSQTGKDFIVLTKIVKYWKLYQTLVLKPASG